MGRPREHDESTRRDLVTAAGRLLASGGADALTTRALADEVGTTTRAIYALFGSKAGLLRAVHREGFEGLRAVLDAVDRSGDPLADLRELALAYRSSALERPDLYQVMFGPPIEGLDPRPDDQDLAAGTLAQLTDTVARCQEAGRLRGEDPMPLTLQLWALVHGLASLELRGALGPPTVAATHWEQALRAAASGYAA